MTFEQALVDGVNSIFFDFAKRHMLVNNDSISPSIGRRCEVDLFNFLKIIIVSLLKITYLVKQ